MVSARRHGDAAASQASPSTTPRARPAALPVAAATTSLGRRRRRGAATAPASPPRRCRGRALQVDPMKSKLKAPGSHCLKLEYGEPLSRFSFKHNLRRCVTAAHGMAGAGSGGGGGGGGGRLRRGQGRRRRRCGSSLSRAPLPCSQGGRRGGDRRGSGASQVASKYSPRSPQPARRPTSRGCGSESEELCLPRDTPNCKPTFLATT